jgi:hypothetical protein
MYSQPMLPTLLPKVMAVDGVSYKLPQWLNEGCSIFLPSINHKRTMKKLRRHYEERGWSLRYEERIEGGKLGIRVWRVA